LKTCAVLSSSAMTPPVPNEKNAVAVKGQKGFQKGNPGRAKGQPNKATREIKAFVLKLFERPKYQRRLKKAWDDGTLDPGIEKLLLTYGFGRPDTNVKVGAELTLLELLKQLPPLKKPEAPGVH
jgi:hypothetical protein